MNKNYDSYGEFLKDFAHFVNELGRNKYVKEILVPYGYYAIGGLFGLALMVLIISLIYMKGKEK